MQDPALRELTDPVNWAILGAFLLPWMILLAAAYSQSPVRRHRW